MTEKNSNSLLKNTTIVSVLTLLSRILGFGRDLLTAFVFGSGWAAEAYIVAFRIPNLLRSFVAEGAFTSAFVPTFSAEVQKGMPEANKSLASISSFLLLITTSLSILGMIFAPEIVGFIAPGFAAYPEKQMLCIELTRIMFPFIIAISFVSMLNGALNSVKIFGVAAMAQIVLNITLILGGLVAIGLTPRSGTWALAISVLVGGIIGVVFQLPTLRRIGFEWHLSSTIFSPATRQILKLMIPALLGASIYQCIIFLNSLFASLLEPGSVSWLYYADRITQLPVGIITMALASVLLPSLSISAQNKDEQSFQRDLVNSLRFTSFMIFPLVGLLFALALPMIQIIFEHGKFDAYSSLKTSYAVKMLALGLWPVSCHSLLVRAFLARKDTVTPTLIGIGSLITNVIASLLFIGPLFPSQSTAPKNSEAAFVWVSRMKEALAPITPDISLGHAGLALGSACGSLFSFFVALIILSRFLGAQSFSPFVRSSITSLIASLASYLAISNSYMAFTNPYLALCIGTLIFGGCFISIHFLLHSKELQETFSLFSRLLLRGKNANTKGTK